MSSFRSRLATYSLERDLRSGRRLGMTRDHTLPENWMATIHISAEHHTVYFDLDENEDAVYAVGLLAYLVGNSDEGDIEVESWEVEGRNIFEFTICSLNEYKRVFVRD